MPASSSRPPTFAEPNVEIGPDSNFDIVADDGLTTLGATAPQGGQWPPMPQPHRPWLWMFSGAFLGSALLVGGYFGWNWLEAPGKLIVEVEPPDARIFIDGKEMAVTGPKDADVTIEVPLGQHELKITKKGFASYTRKLIMNARSTEVVRLKLEPTAVAKLPVPPPPEKVAEKAPPVSEIPVKKEGPVKKEFPKPIPKKLDPPAKGPVAKGPHPVNVWESLFNGKDLKGWKIHPAEKAKWLVKDGVLTGAGPFGCLFSERDDYQNFNMVIEALINDGGEGSVLFRADFGPSPKIKGYEAKISGNHLDPLKTGSLINFVKVANQLHKPNTWFTQEITAMSNHIIITVNGKKVVDFVDKNHVHAKGHFALRHNPNLASAVKFRKIEVRELPAP